MDSTWDIFNWFRENESDWWILIIAFTAAQLVNVLLSTIRSVVLIKGSRKTAVIFNAVSYTIGALVTGLIAGVVKNVPLICLVTAATNLAGTWMGLLIIDKVRKDQLWRISATVRSSQFQDLVNDLHRSKVDFITYETQWTERTPIDVFSKSKEESSLIKEIFKKYNVKYTINTDTKML